MAFMVRVVHLTVIVAIVLYSTEGLLLQKHVPQLLDGGEQRYLDAFPYFTKSIELFGNLSGEVHFETGSFSTAPSDGDQQVVPGQSPTAHGSEQEKMYLIARSTRVAKGVLGKSTTPKSDFFNLVPMALQSLSESTSMVVTKVREHGSAVPTSTLRLFTGGQRTNRTCDSSKPPLLARCGDHYLFPGYNVKLVKNEGLTAKEAKKCQWRFRHSAAEVLVTLKGVKRKQDVFVSVKEVDVAAGLLVSSPKEYRVNKKTRRQVFRDVLISLPEHAQDKGISVEVCVPAGPKHHVPYRWNHQPRVPCGIPKGTTSDKDFDMNTIPWQALITVTVEYQSPSGDTKYATTYCSGSLIAEEWVVTTASCLLRPETDHPGAIPALFVTFGSGKLSEKYEVSEFISYPTVTEDHDIALIRMSKKTKRQRVCLPNTIQSSDLHSFGGKGTVFGWIVESKDVYYMAALRQNTLNSDDCSRRLGRRLAPHMICSLDDTKGNPCLADGNFMFEYNGEFTLQGVVTPRLHCNDDYRPHTLLGFFMPWVRNVTGITDPN